MIKPILTGKMEMILLLLRVITQSIQRPKSSNLNALLLILGNFKCASGRSVLYQAMVIYLWKHPHMQIGQDT